MSESPYRGRRVLVLGAGGFIGRWVARRLAAAGADLLLAVRDPARFGGLREAYGIRGQVLAVDLEPAGSAARLVATAAPDIVFNLAGYGVDPSERDPERSRRLNVALLSELLDPLSRGGTGWHGLRLVHAGSALEYGDVGGDLAEDVAPQPTTLYGRDKLAGTAVVSAAAANGLAALTARLFTVYGPGEHDGRLLPTLLAASRTEGILPLTMGTQQRDFTYVDDVARGLLELGLLPKPTYPVVNLATGNLCQVKDFALVAARVLHISPDRLGFGILPSRAEEMKHSAVRTARLRELLGWSPETGLEAGIAATVRFLFGSREPGKGEGYGV